MTPTSAGVQVHDLAVRAATDVDVPRLHEIVLQAARRLLSGTHWTPVQVAAAERAGMFELDIGLVAAGTYYLAAVDGIVVAGSGWSAGGRMIPTGDAGPADSDTAVMRATYVDPDRARQGLATLLAHTTETAARLAGFTRFEALCTPPSAALRRGLGYSLVGREEVEALPGVTVPGLRMRKIVR